MSGGLFLDGQGWSRGIIHGLCVTWLCRDGDALQNEERLHRSLWQLLALLQTWAWPSFRFGPEVKWDAQAAFNMWQWDTSEEVKPHNLTVYRVLSIGVNTTEVFKQAKPCKEESAPTLQIKGLRVIKYYRTNVHVQRNVIKGRLFLFQNFHQIMPLSQSVL